MKWIKVYRGPGYPVDPQKELRRAVAAMLDSIEKSMEFRCEMQFHSLRESVAETVAPFWTPNITEAQRAFMNQPHDPNSFHAEGGTEVPRWPMWVTSGGALSHCYDANYEAYLNSVLASAPQEAQFQPFAHGTWRDPDERTKEQVMDDLQARARQWTKKFLNPKVLTVAEKKERREVEQYMQGGDPLT